MKVNKKILSDIVIYLSLVILMLVYAFVMDRYNLALFGYEPHPLLLITVVLSAYRGLLFAILGSVASSIVYLSLLHLQVDYEKVETILSWSYFSLPSSILFLSIFVGMIRQTTHDRYKQMLKQREEEIDKVLKLEGIKKKIEIENRELKERLVTRQNSIENLYQVSSKMSEVDKDILVEGFLEVLEDYCHVKKSCIYSLSTSELLAFRGFEVLPPKSIKSGWENGIQLYRKSKNPISIMDLENNKLSTGDIDSPLLYQGLEDKDGNLWGILLIFDIPFLKYIPSTFKMINVYSRWVSQSFIRISNINKLEDSLLVDTELNIFKRQYYLDRLEEEIEQAKAQNLDFSILKLYFSNWSSLSPGKQKIAYKLLIENSRLFTKKMDIISKGEKAGEVEIIVIGQKKRAIELIKKINDELKKYNIDRDSLKLNIKLCEFHGQIRNRSDYQQFFVEV